MPRGDVGWVRAGRAAGAGRSGTRIDVVRQLATNRATVDRIRRELAEAEQADAASFAECTRAGWTEAELKRIGFDPPKRRSPGRPRRARPAPTPTPATTAADEATSG